MNYFYLDFFKFIGKIEYQRERFQFFVVQFFIEGVCAFFIILILGYTLGMVYREDVDGYNLNKNVGREILGRYMSW